MDRNATPLKSIGYHLERAALKHLKSWSGVGGRMRDFKGSLGEALGELERVGLIKSIRIKTNAQGEEQAVWVRL